MIKNSILILSAGILLVACGTAKPTADQQLAQAVQQMEETNSTAVIYQQRQSHGLFGDMIDNTFKTVTGQN